MNALYNSQLEELKKYLDPGCPDDSKIISACYTGQESPEEREKIDSPDTLLTNSVMLEYTLSRQEPLDQQVVSDAKGLEFLLLDELHTSAPAKELILLCWCDACARN